VEKYGDLSGSDVSIVSNALGLRLALTFKNSTVISGGTGSETDPFIVE